jgi:hypothetical protein
MLYIILMGLNGTWLRQLVEGLATERRAEARFPAWVRDFTVSRLYGLVVRMSGYRSGGPGSIPGASRFFEK